MRGAFQIARFFDIPVRLHWSFFLLPAYVVFTNYSQGGNWLDSVWSLLFISAIFGCVVLHEYGHVLSARRFGVGTKDIILSPIGGVARLYQLPERPEQELVVAVAGPMVNLVIAAIFGAWSWWFAPGELSQLVGLFYGKPLMLAESGSFLPFFIPALFVLNIALAAFNLIPAFPMDGGRVLRALLALYFSRLTATRIASLAGQLIAVALSVFALMSGNYLTALIGAFVFYMATLEYRHAKIAYLQPKEL